MKLSTVEQWLAYISQLHPQKMALGLDRVKSVANKLNVKSFTCPVIIVGGTNGKGSCVATLADVYAAAGYKVGAYTSPALYSLNEQIRIAGNNISDLALCDAFAQVVAKRGDIALTLFEIFTLAALWLFSSAELDVVILEVGLGGRLDAVNVIDADVAVVTSVDIDHAEWLGDTRELIGFEKAGIFRQHQPAIVGEANPPQSLRQHALKIGAQLQVLGQAYEFGEDENSWWWHADDVRLSVLPVTPLLAQNVACALMAVHCLQSRLAVEESVIKRALAKLSLPGRVEIVSGPILQIMDVAHNPAAVSVLNSYLQRHPVPGKTHAVFSMLADKDIAGCVRRVRGEIDVWHVASLKASRGATLEVLRGIILECDPLKAIVSYDNIARALSGAKDAAHIQDRIVLFGSFHTLAERFYGAAP
jgi:dihydrofolate synthase/folylpolyglutamate synthase